VPQHIIEMMVALGASLNRDPSDDSRLMWAYSAVVTDLLRMLREHDRLDYDYTHAFVSHVEGLSAIPLFTGRADGAMTVTAAEMFPSFPFCELDRLNRHVFLLARAFPMRLRAPPATYELFGEHRFVAEGHRASSVQISPAAPIVLAGAFLPVWFNGDGPETDATFDLGVPMSEGVFPEWSPMPDAMNARPASHRVPDQFIMPNALEPRVTTATRVRQAIPGRFRNGKEISWRQNAYSNRVFLVPDGRVVPGTCAYRMGRFVAGCTVPNDMSYSWQAELGSFESVVVEDGRRLLIYVPRQHVCLVFAHAGNPWTRLQFNNRCVPADGQHPRPSLSPSSSMQTFCGTIVVRCCVSEECVDTCRVENGPWQCGVFRTFDGTLRTFLDGPDVELHDVSGGAGPMRENLRGELLRFACGGPVPYDMRFGARHDMDAAEYWSRFVTFVHVVDRIMSCVAEVAIGDNFGSFPAICPENFVYSTGGLSLANVAGSLYLVSPVKKTNSDAVYCRVTGYDIQLARRFMRRDLYDFKMLGACGSCSASYATIPAVMEDSRRRFLPSDIVSVRDEYPDRHVGDRFLPCKNLANMTPSTVVAQRDALIVVQTIIMIRYIFFEMGLCGRSCYAAAAEMQVSPKPVSIAGEGREGVRLFDRAYDAHDLGIVFAQRLIPRAVLDDMFSFSEHHRMLGSLPAPTETSTILLDDIGRMLGILSQETELEAMSRLTRTDYASRDAAAINGAMMSRFRGLGDSVSRIVNTLNSRRPGGSDSMTEQLDATPMK
jgi:hypothetical protein